MVLLFTTGCSNLVSHNSGKAKKYLDSGDAKYNLDDYTGAIADYNQAIETEPEFAAAYYNRGYTKATTLHQIESGCLDLKKAQALGNPNANDLIQKILQIAGCVKQH